MSRPDDATEGRFTLPLFLLSTVLFPGATLSLHIFEQRYRAMIRRCLEAPDPVFGVFLIKEGDEVVEGPAGGRPAIPHDAGTVAQIVGATRLPDGRYGIVCLGRERIRLYRLMPPDPYLTGEVAPLPDADLPGDATAVGRLAGEVRQGLIDLLTIVREASPPGDQRQRLRLDALIRAIPTEPADLSYFVPRLLVSAPADDCQRLLVADTVRHRLELEVEFLTRERQLVGRHFQAWRRLQLEPGISVPSIN